MVQEKVGRYLSNVSMVQEKVDRYLSNSMVQEKVGKEGGWVPEYGAGEGG